MSHQFYLVLALFGGVVIAMQGLINGRLSAELGGPVMAALVSFSVGWLCLAALNASLVFSRAAPAPSLAAVAGMPWWAWTGGLIGAFLVSTAAAAVPKLGVATYISAVIAAQLVTAALLDHFGAFGYQPRPISWTKLAGLAALALGVVLVRTG